MENSGPSFEAVGALRILRAVAFAIGLPAFMVGTAVFMLGFSLERPGILAAAATLHGVAVAALLWWVLSRVVPVGGFWRGLCIVAGMLAGAVLWRAMALWVAVSLLHGAG